MTPEPTIGRMCRQLAVRASLLPAYRQAGQAGLLTYTARLSTVILTIYGV